MLISCQLFYAPLGLKKKSGRTNNIVLEVESLFSRIKSEQNGRLDVLVNNAYAGVNTIFTVGLITDF